MAVSKEYSDLEKQEILDHAELNGVSTTARQYDVSRQAIYNWRKDADEISTNVAIARRLSASDGKSLSQFKSVGEMAKYVELLKREGTLKDRKQKQGAKAEANLVKIIDLLENHPQLDQIHPKDLSKIMLDLNTIKKDLYDEPTIIIEYRNTWMQRVLQVLTDFLTNDELRAFVHKIETIEETTYEEVN